MEQWQTCPGVAIWQPSGYAETMIEGGVPSYGATEVRYLMQPPVPVLFETRPRRGFTVFRAYIRPHPMHVRVLYTWFSCATALSSSSKRRLGRRRRACPMAFRPSKRGGCCFPGTRQRTRLEAWRVIMHSLRPFLDYSLSLKGCVPISMDVENKDRDLFMHWKAL